MTSAVAPHEFDLAACERSLPGTRVLIGSGCRNEVPARLGEMFHDQPRVVIADERVLELWRHDPLLDMPSLGVVPVPAGETAKTPAVLAATVECLNQLGLPRSGHIVAVGGGATLDLAGLAAALHLRGVEAVYVPTTLLAMVDAALGGKCAVNLEAGKNLLGVFWPPRLLIADPELLTTLPDTDVLPALGEVAKYGLGFDGAFAGWLAANAPALATRSPEAIEHVIRRCLEIKATIVASDPFESPGGPRQLLNLGHTTAHALEAYGAATGRPIPHGIAVALGLRVACTLAADRRTMSATDLARATALLDALGLPRRAKTWLQPPEPAELLPYLGRDKKRRSERATVVLPRGIGACVTSEIEPMDLAARIQAIG